MSRRIPSASWLVQFQPTAPGRWLCSYAVVSTSTSTKRTVGSSRCASAQSLSTSAFSVAYPLLLIRAVPPAYRCSCGDASVRSSRRSLSAAGGRSVPATEFGQPLHTRVGLALRLTNDPGVDPARILDRDRRPDRPVLDDDAGRAAIVGHPV